MTTIQQAIEAAVTSILNMGGYVCDLERHGVVEVISGHVLPVVEAAEKERDEFRDQLDQLMSSVKNQHTDTRHHADEWGPAVTLAMDTRMERDGALAKLAEARGLLTEIWDDLPGPQVRDDILGHEVVDRVDAFLSPSTQATEKT